MERLPRAREGDGAPLAHAPTNFLVFLGGGTPPPPPPPPRGGLGGGGPPPPPPPRENICPFRIMSGRVRNVSECIRN